MLTAQWIKEAQQAGWLVKGSTGLELRLQCPKHGCKATITVSVHNLGPVPEPCTKPHFDQYSLPTFEQYEATVFELQRRRRALGLSQEDICAASGLTDGHINKLEAFHRIAVFPTLQLWAQTLGLRITLEETQLPPATARAIESRASHPYKDNQAQFKIQNRKTRTHD